VDLDWWTGTIDVARLTDVFDNDPLTSGSVWVDFCEQLKAAGAQIQREDAPGSPLDRATGFRHLMALLWTGINQAMTYSSPLHPRMSQVARTDVYKWGLDCPDAAYRSASIDGRHNYRITGRLGTVHYLSFQVNEGMANHGNMRGDQLELEPDGSFVLWVGPDARTGNWMPTPPGADFLIVRQFFYDWSTEEPAELEIERVVGPGDSLGELDNPNAASPDRVARQLSSIATWLNASAKFWIDVEVMGQMTDRNRFQAATAKPESGGAIENLNGWGHFDLAPDDALIIDVQPAHALYWSVHLGNFWWESLDYCYRHTSLNGFQADLDPDGRFRAVIAHEDPGVANWLDTCGHARGPMLFRWIVADHAPDPTCTVVPFSQVREHLPDTTRLVSPAQRHDIIAGRRDGVLRRFSP
jgi:Protein of unknown function (DUF1214)